MHKTTQYMDDFSYIHNNISVFISCTSTFLFSGNTNKNFIHFFICNMVYLKCNITNITSLILQCLRLKMLNFVRQIYTAHSSNIQSNSNLYCDFNSHALIKFILVHYYTTTTNLLRSYKTCKIRFTLLGIACIHLLYHQLIE